MLRLTYLPFRAMAETTRFILRHGGVAHQNEVVWGHEFARLRDARKFPFNKVPVLHTADGTTVAQSGSIARYAAKLAGCYPIEPEWCAFNDAVFEMAQEMCTINPMINCYVGAEYDRCHRWYFSTFPTALDGLERQLLIARSARAGAFFGGLAPSHADFNVYHHLANARLAEPECVKSKALCEWMAAVEALPAMAAYLVERPRLVGVGTNPGLVDKTGRFVCQRDPEGQALLVEGVFVFSRQQKSH